MYITCDILKLENMDTVPQKHDSNSISFNAKALLKWRTLIDRISEIWWL